MDKASRHSHARDSSLLGSKGTASLAPPHPEGLQQLVFLLQLAGVQRGTNKLLIVQAPVCVCVCWWVGNIRPSHTPVRSAHTPDVFVLLPLASCCVVTALTCMLKGWRSMALAQLLHPTPHIQGTHPHLLWLRSAMSMI